VVIDTRCPMIDRLTSLHCTFHGSNPIHTTACFGVCVCVCVCVCDVIGRHHGCHVTAVRNVNIGVLNVFVIDRDNRRLFLFPFSTSNLSLPCFLTANMLAIAIVYWTCGHCRVLYCFHSLISLSSFGSSIEGNDLRF